MESAPVLVAGAWRGSEGSAIFHSVDPATTEAELTNAIRAQLPTRRKRTALALW